MQVAPNETDLHEFDGDKFDYSLDPGATMGVSASDPLCSNNIRSFRILALPKGNSIAAGPAGHIYVNIASGVKAEVVCLPALVAMKDPGVPPMLGLYAKESKDLKTVYIACLPIPFVVPGPKVKFLADGDVTMVKVSLIASAEVLEDQDGMPRRKEYKKWLSEKPHTMFKAIKADTEARVDAFSQPGKFGTGIKSVLDACELRIRRESQADAGQTQLQKGGRKSASKEVVKSAELSAVDIRLSDIKTLRSSMKALTPYFNVSIGRRIMEVSIDPDKEDDQDFVAGMTEYVPNIP